MNNFYKGILILSFSLSYLPGTIFSSLIGINPIEPIILLGIILLYKSFKPFRIVFHDVLKNKYFVIVFFYCSLMFTIGFVVTNSFSSVYADFRANLIFFFGLFFFSSNKWESAARVKLIISLLWGLTIFDFLAMLIRPYLEIFNQDGLIKHNVSTIAPVFLMVYYMNKGKLKFVFLFLLIVVYEVAFSFMRDVYVITAIGVLLLFITVVKNLKNKRINKFYSIIFFGFFTFIAIQNFGRLIDYWEEDGSRSIHSIRRTQESFDDIENESVRINSFLLPFLDADKIILPKGLGAREHIQKSRKLFDYKILSTNDSSFFYFSYHYGIIFSVFFLFFFIKEPVLRLFGFFFKREYYLFFICLGFFSYILLMFFSKSILLSFPPAAITFSMIYAAIINPKDFYRF